jgi:hypothetical protein
MQAEKEVATSLQQPQINNRTTKVEWLKGIVF